MKSLTEQIHPNIVRQAKKLSKITQFLHIFLPVECHQHVRVGGINRQVLTLISDSPVWTTRLRQLSPQMLKHLNENKNALADCIDAAPFQTNTNHSPSDAQLLIQHIQVNTRFSNHRESAEERVKRVRSKRPAFSQGSAMILSRAADDIKHERLKASLKKLAGHASFDDNTADGTASDDPATDSD